MDIQSLLHEDYCSLHSKFKSPVSREDSIKRFSRLISPHLPYPCLHAVDLGAGQGELLVALKRLGCTDSIGIESSFSQISAAKAHGFESLIQEDGLSWIRSQADCSFDLVTCFDVLEHLTKSECFSWLLEIRRILRPGGRLIGHLPNGLSPFVGSVYLADLTHRWCPVPDSVEVFSRAAGLTWYGSFDDIGASPTLKGMFRSILWKVLRYFFHTFSLIETGSFNRNQPFSRNFIFIAQRDT